MHPPSFAPFVLWEVIHFLGDPWGSWAALHLGPLLSNSGQTLAHTSEERCFSTPQVPAWTEEEHGVWAGVA